jgi:hypothetical protein
VVEPTGFKVKCIQNPLVEPQFILNVEIDELSYKEVNVNISTQLISVLTKGMHFLQSENETEEIDLEQEIDYDLVVRVSPYKIINLTGYKILVTREFTESQKALRENLL